MIRIVNGKRYNTETAEELCDISRGGYSRSDFNYEDTRLFEADPEGRGLPVT